MLAPARARSRPRPRVPRWPDRARTGAAVVIRRPGAARPDPRPSPRPCRSAADRPRCPSSSRWRTRSRGSAGAQGCAQRCASCRLPLVSWARRGRLRVVGAQVCGGADVFLVLDVPAAGAREGGGQHRDGEHAAHADDDVDDPLADAVDAVRRTGLREDPLDKVPLEQTHQQPVDGADDREQQAQTAYRVVGIPHDDRPSRCSWRRSFCGAPGRRCDRGPLSCKRFPGVCRLNGAL